MQKNLNADLRIWILEDRRTKKTLKSSVKSGYMYATDIGSQVPYTGISPDVYACVYNQRPVI